MSPSKGKKNQWEGAITALVTPFCNEQIDYDSLERLIEGEIEGGIDALLPCGTTGESPTLSHDEHKEVMRFVVKKARGRLPVICGTGSNSTAEALELTRFAREIKSDGALLVVPYYNKPTQEGLYRHFQLIAREVPLPIILYNIPGRTGVNLLPETVARLAEIPNIVGIKEASGSLDQVSQICSSSGITVLSGDDSLTLPMMAVGARGVVSVASNLIPERISRLVHSFLEGKAEEARKIHYELFPLLKILFVETNPIPVKAALAMTGKIKDELRLPLVPMSEGNREKLAEVLEELGLIGMKKRVESGK